MSNALPTMNRAARRAQRRALRPTWRQPVALFGIFVLAMWLLAAVLAPWIAPSDPNTLGELPYASPSADHLFGTDGLGRDVLSRVIYGARTSFPIAVVVVVVSL